VSSPLAALAYNKPAQLTALARAGLSIPPFVITNDASVAGSFLRQHKDAIVKPASGGGFAMPINAKQVGDLPLRRAPAIFQKRVRGDDIRVTTVRGKLLSAVRIVNDDADSAVPDFRAQSAYRAGTTRYEPIKPSAGLQKVCSKILETCGMHFGGIDFKRDAAGNLHVLECNAQPGWLAIEAATGEPVTRGLARYLLDLA
jgi:glutathione synthase/RimK-type ligase-like ATP-grasp enzyme